MVGGGRLHVVMDSQNESRAQVQTAGGVSGSGWGSGWERVCVLHSHGCLMVFKTQQLWDGRRDLFGVRLDKDRRNCLDVAVRS